jgi:hypothetical protein
MLRAKWVAWKRRQPSQTRYAVVPNGTRITASGLKAQSRLVELRGQVML